MEEEKINIGNLILIIGESYFLVSEEEATYPISSAHRKLISGGWKRKHLKTVRCENLVAEPTYPAEHLAILEPGNPTIHVSEQLTNSPSTDGFCFYKTMKCSDM